ncbi:hypothetical protein BDQ17DRAFT_1431781 [Cyathus striatus]|nr:hypothetical protein BDQ17DRAFT_1431781 [Cyathus striatus]
MSQTSLHPYVRLARRDELKYIAKMMQRAFISDPSLNYLAGLNKPLTSKPRDYCRRRNLEKYFNYTLKQCWLSKSRITVVVIPQDPQKPSSGEKIISCSVWAPPKQSNTHGILSCIRSGLISVVCGWGLGLFKRVNALVDTIEEAFYTGLDMLGMKSTASEEYWYLQLVGTEPEYQGQGMFSLLMREAFTYSPSFVFALDASTTSARDKYAHLGFVPMEEVIIGKGKVDANGIVTSKNGSGFPMYPMVKPEYEKSY